jgi:hypothetical protein
MQKETFYEYAVELILARGMSSNGLPEEDEGVGIWSISPSYNRTSFTLTFLHKRMSKMPPQRRNPEIV